MTTREELRTMLRKSTLEADLAFQIRGVGLPEPMREFHFHPTRKFRFDFAWLERMVAVECEGGIYTNGRHTRGPSFEMDAFKYNEATCLGWRVLRVTRKQVDSGEALRWIQRALA